MPPELGPGLLSPTVQRVFERELASSLRRMQAQRKLLGRGDETADKLAGEAHRVKGAAAVAGHSHVRMLAGALEQEAAASNLRLEQIDDLLAGLAAQVGELTRFHSPAGRAPPAADASPPGTTPAGKGLLVLQIDDDPVNQALIGKILATRAVRVLTARNAETGVSLARRHRPSLILLDLNLPDENGEHVLRRLRGMPGTRTIPVIVLSGETDEKRRMSVFELGARGYLTKPFRIAELLSLLDELCGDEPPRQTGHPGADVGHRRTQRRVEVGRVVG